MTTQDTCVGCGYTFSKVSSTEKEIKSRFVEYDDKSIMPFGQHKGKQLDQVPEEYLIFLYENDRAGRLTEYIEKNVIA